MKDKQLIILSIAAIFLLGFFFFLLSIPGSTRIRHITEAVKTFSEVLTGEKPTTLVFVGDIMLSRNIGDIMKAKGFDYPYLKLGDFISNADIAFANLETPVSDRGSNVGSIYSFRTVPEALPALFNAGFDIVSIANNHIWDWGRDAFLDTLTNLDQNNILHAGGGIDFNSAHTPAIIERNGVKFAFLAYTKLVPSFLQASTSAPAVAYPSVENIQRDILNAKELGADVVITSFHWGTEYSTVHDADQERLAHAAIDDGALIVVGHHPHVEEEIERYKNGLIMYSLGNFIFDQNFSPDTREGLAVKVIVQDGTIKSFEPVKILFTNTYQPYASSSNVVN